MILNIIVIGILLVIVLPYTLYKMYGTKNLISTKEYLILSIIIEEQALKYINTLKHKKKYTEWYYKQLL